MKAIKKLTAALLILSVVIPGTAQEFKTSLKVTKGQEYNYENTVVMDMTQSMAGQEIKVNNNSSATSKFVIDKVLPTGNVEILTSIWDVKSSTKAPMMDTTFSFSGKASPTYKLILDQYGNIISKEKVDTTGINNSMNSAFDMENKLSGSGMFCEFPQKNLQPGEKWSKSTSDSISNMGGKMGLVVNTDYTLGEKESVDGKTLQKVSYTSAIEIGGKSKMQGMDLFIEGTGVQNGNMYLDPVTKVIIDNQSEIELDMNIAVSGQQSMTIPMTQKMKVTQKLKK